MTRDELGKLSYRARLLACARDAAQCQYYRRYGIEADLSYLESASDERLRTIVRAWFGTDNPDAVLLADPAYRGLT